MSKVLVSDKLSDGGLQVIREAQGLELDYKPGLSEDELAAIIGEYSGLVIRSGSKVTAKVLANAESLRVIGRAGIGVDNVDVPAASRRGIVVMNTPTGNAVTTAEHAVALMMAAARKIPQATASMRAGKWEKSKFQGRELTDKVLGVIGLGNIGRIVANRAQGLHMRVIGFDPILSTEDAAALGIELVAIEELFAQADVITAHTPLNDGTRGLLGEKAFAAMKKGVIVVNAARGGIVDESALLAALESGKVGAAALDVFVKEPPPADQPLFAHPNLTLTPHLGASTDEAQERVALEIAEQVAAYLKDGTVKNAVNMPSLTGEQSRAIAPYVVVARRLGLLLGQLEPVAPQELRVTCTGDFHRQAVRALAAEAMAGFLKHQSNEAVNPISAPFEARARGIELVEIAEPQTVGSVSVRVTVTGDQGLHTATGELGGNQQPRLVGLDGYEVDTPLEGRLIVMRNDDRPGVIGAVGTVLGSREINVSRMHVGLDESTRQAIAIWRIDAPCPEDTVEALRALDHVGSVVTAEV